MTGPDSFSLESRVVLLGERDRLALDWELHHSRWALFEARSTVEGATNSQRMPPLEPGKRVAHYETSPDEHNRHMDERWRRLPDYIDRILHHHDAERVWWKQNKDTASLDLLRQAVRTIMGEAGGATADEPVLDATAKQTVPEPPKEIRPLRWLLIVRAEIARRRMMLGELDLLVREGQEQGLLWAEERLPALLHRISEMGYGDEAITDKDTTQLSELVNRRESAAAAFQITGPQLAPALLDLDAIGAASL